MKESEFRVRFSKFGLREDGPTADAAVALAKEAGATFEPELYHLPVLTRGNSVVAPSLIVRFDGQHLSYEEVEEVLRRCKAVEEAVEFLRNSDLHSACATNRLLAILEGTK